MADEGLRIGTVRRPPRGVRKLEFARRDYFDVWLPELAPSEAWTGERWQAFAKKYRAQMKRPEPQRLLTLLAALSKQTNFSVGCYCEDDSHCHRSLLREVLAQQGAVIHD